jgi:transposase
MSQRRYELSDEQFALIEPLLPVPTRGPQRADDRITLNGIFWKLCSGAPWRDVPARYGKWQTVYERFRRYRERGVFDRILAALHLRLAADGNLDFATWMIDGTTVRASRHAAGARKRGTHRARLRHASRSGGAEAD